MQECDKGKSHINNKLHMIYISFNNKYCCPNAVTSLKENDQICNYCYTIYIGVYMTTVEIHGGILLKYAVFRHRIVR